MRRPLLAVATTALALVWLAAPALAHPGVVLDPTLPFDVTYESTDNVEHLGRFPEHIGTAGGQPSDDGSLFYLTDPRGVYVYDTSEPENPVLKGSLPLYQTTTGVALAQEDPDTDGEILLVDAATSPASTSSQLRVVDVSDPSAPTLVGSAPVTDHTWTCVSDVAEDGTVDTCAFAFGRTGHIVDLRDPTRPTKVGDWRQATGYSAYTHDLTEIRPGLVMTAGANSLLLDTSDPEFPVKLAEIGDPARFASTGLGYHSVEWPRDGADRFVVLGTEIAPGAVPGAPPNTAGSDCEGTESVIETWDARKVKEALEEYEVTRDPAVFDGVEFTKVDSYSASGRGTFLTGQAAASQLYCAHWMETHPDFQDGGLLAVAYYNRGTRFLEVGGDGVMTEVGWMTPAEGYAGSPQWISDEVVYAMDYRRGLEVLRLEPAEATRVVKRSTDVVAPASTFGLPPVDPMSRELAVGGSALLVLLVAAVGRVARRRAVRTA